MNSGGVEEEFLIIDGTYAIAIPKILGCMHRTTQPHGRPRDAGI